MSEETKMPFGKHKGLPISEVPVKYLDWLIGEPWFEKFEDLKKEIEEYLEGDAEWQRM